jgi:hypothetical protein
LEAGKGFGGLVGEICWNSGITGKKTGNFAFACQNLRISRQIREFSKNNSGLTAE